MPPSSLPAIDDRVLKEDYCNFDLIARYWNDECRGRIWKNKERVADAEGTDLDDIMDELKSMVDQIQADKRKKRGRRKPDAGDIAEALRGIEPKLSDAQKMMLSLQFRSPTHGISVKSLIRLSDQTEAKRAFGEYLKMAQRLSDELAYCPAAKRKGGNPVITLLATEDVITRKLGEHTILTLRTEIVEALELLGW